MFNNLKILNVFNLYIYFTATESMKILTSQSPKILFDHFQVSGHSNRLILPQFHLESMKSKSFIFNGSKILNYFMEHAIPYFGMISLSVFKSRIKRHLLTNQSQSRTGDNEWLPCNHNIFSHITFI